MDHTIENAVVLIASDKAKERQEGLLRYREAFSDPGVLSSLPDVLDAKDIRTGKPCWTSVFQSLFDALFIERSICIKKAKGGGGTGELQAAALKRFQDVAILVSWMVDQARLRIGRKTTRAVFAHLTQTLGAENAQLLDALIPPYLRALKSLLTWKPHADHLEEKSWLDGVSICWNLLLGDKVSDRITGSDEVDLERYANVLAVAAADRKSGSATLTNAHAADAFLCLQAMFESCVAPLVGLAGERFGIHMLEKYVRYFVLRPSESTVTLPVISSLNVLLRALQLNERILTTTFATIIWPPLLRLFTTKSLTLKEHVLITLDLLLPLLAVPPPSVCGSASEETAKKKRRAELRAKLQDLQHLLVKEPLSRTGLRPLPLGILSLRHIPIDEGAFTEPCQTMTFQASFGFAAPNTHDWCGLELAADVISFLMKSDREVLHTLEDEQHNRGPPVKDASLMPEKRERSDKANSRMEVSATPNPAVQVEVGLAAKTRCKVKTPASSTDAHDRPAKRVRTSERMLAPGLLPGTQQEPWLEYFSEVRASDPSSKMRRLWGLQVLAMWMEKHPEDATKALNDDLAGEIAEASNDSDEEIASWATLTLACATALQTNSNESSRWKIWPRIWSLITRRVALPHLSRASATLANAMLRCSLVDTATLPKDVSTIIFELSSQAITRPSEALCDLLSRSLEIIDANRASIDPAVVKGALALVQSLWIPSFASSPATSTAFDASVHCPAATMLHLLAQLGGLQHCPNLTVGKPFLEGSACIRNLAANIEHRAMLRYVIFAELDEAKVPTSTSKHQPIPRETLFIPLDPNTPASRLSSSLASSIKVVLENFNVRAMDMVGPSVLSQYHSYQLRQFVEFAALVLLFRGLMHVNGFSTPSELFMKPLQTLQTVANECALRTRTVEEKHFILSPLVCLGLPAPISAARSAIVPPARRSGVRHEHFIQFTGPHRQLADQGVQHFLRACFEIEDSMPDTCALSDALAQVIKVISPEVEMAKPDLLQGEDDSMEADYEYDKQVKDVPIPGNVTLDVLLNGSIRYEITSFVFAIIAVMHAVRKQSSSQNQRRPLHLILENGADLARVIMLLPAAVHATDSGLLSLDDMELQELLSITGEELLPKYQYSRDPVAHSITLKVIRIVIRHEKFAADSVGLRDMCRWFMIHSAKAKTFFVWETVSDIAELLYDFLTCSGLVDIWNPDGECVSNIEPTQIMQNLQGAADLRTRFHAATLLGALFNDLAITPGDEAVEQEQRLFPQLQNVAILDVTKFEGTLTTLLLFGNITVLSSLNRSDGLGSLLEIAMRRRDYSAHFASVMKCVASHLGFDSTMELYSTFAAQIVYSIHQLNQDTLAVPWEALGYRSQRAWATSNLPAIGLMLLELFEGEDGSGDFDVFCKMARVEREMALDICRPSIAAFELGDSATRLRQGTTAVTAGAVWDLAVTNLRQCEKSGASAKVMHQRLKDAKDLVTAWLMRFAWLKDHTTSDELLLEIATFGHNQAAALRKVSSPPSSSLSDVSELHEPPRPFHDPKALLNALSTLDHQAGGIFDASSGYHILHHLFGFIFDAKLVNDQKRLLRGVIIYVSMCYNAVQKSQAILNLILRNCSSLLKEVDLIPLAATLLNWAATTAKYSAARSRCWIVALARAGYAVASHLRSSDAEAVRLGIQCRQWLQKLASNCLAVPATEKIVLWVLLFWPDIIAETLSLKVQALSLPQVMDALAQLPDLSISNSALTIILSKVRDADSADRAIFAEEGLWLLKQQAISRQREAQTQARFAHLLAQILVQSGGQYRMPFAPASTRFAQTIRRAKAWGLESPKGATTFSAEHTFLGLVLRFWHNLEDGNHQDLLLCLRSVMAHTASVDDFLEGMDSSDAEELRLIAAFRSNSLNISHRTLNESLELIPSSTSATYSVWIGAICEAICVSLATPTSAFGNIYVQLVPLARRYTKLAEQMGPLLIRRVLQADEGACDEKDLRALYQFFNHVTKSAAADKRMHTFVVDCVLYLRQAEHKDSGVNLSLAIDYLALANRALDAGMFTAAAMFIEIHRESRSRQSLDPDAQLESSLLDQVYSNVDDPDSFYSIPTSGSHAALLELMHHEGRWQFAFEIAAAYFEVDRQLESRTSVATMATPLHQLGFNAFATSLINTRDAQPSGQSNHIQYDMAWQSANWDLPAHGDNADAGSGQTLYQALRAVTFAHDKSHAVEAVSLALRRQLQGFGRMASEPGKALSASCLELIGLSEVQSWLDKCKRSPMSMSALEAISADYMREPPSGVDSQVRVRILQVRKSLAYGCRSALVRTSVGGWNDEGVARAVKIESHLCREIAKAARVEKRLQAALAMSKLVQNLEESTGQIEFSSVLEFAQTLWSYGQHTAAQNYLTQAMTDRLRIPLALDDGDIGEGLTQSGVWHAEARSEQPQVIEDNYFQRALKLSTGSSVNVTQQSKVFHRFASFAHDQYIRDASSGEIARLKEAVEKRTEEVRQHEALERSSREYSHQHSRHARTILEQDRASLSMLERRQAAALEQALTMFAQSFITSDLFDNSLIRFTSLWFENSANNILNAKIENLINKIPSHKFVLLTHQISARLSKPGASPYATPEEPNRQRFHRIISLTMARMCKDHPFHTMYSLYAMRSRNVTAESQKSSSRRRATLTPSVAPSQTLRAAAADEIWDALLRQKERRGQLRDFSLACDSYVEWAILDLHNYGTRFFNKSGTLKQSKDIKLPSSRELKLAALHDLPIPVATIDLPVDISCKYESFVGVARYSSTFSTAGGIHLPKISDCIGSDGQRYRQLFKNNDDLRQDAVMQQVFRIVNGLLEEDTQSRRRNLRMRTYIVRPLGDQWGLLQFVSNTKPIGEPLLDLHSRHRRKGEITPHEGRGAIAAVGKASKSQRLYVFEDCCRKLPPIFRRFFTEEFKDPMAWFSSRLTYTRSVAVGSIVGYVLGLGDRHLSNILIDVANGELVHIDFGIAFDQGKLLPIPELVPFRLTRDIVDGMGMPGIDGAFRQCCQQTLRVLRQGTELIKTILEVFKYDPLFSWTANPVKAIRAQERDDVSDGNTTRSGLMPPDITNGAPISTAEISADRAVATVMQKLAPTLSVEYTVNDLIQQARDPQNLAVIFNGESIVLEPKAESVDALHRV
ncbi:hypothetical protein K437DRAFT_241928 [Tilletiaria anomala UBC 951]|uniref:Serine/threonine-protein kinase Tel1 n=1 Tax=Tilletiaria anomala (strain ATCC 24038 / CBS 436.72 / UBC 951) TaxID=1037660 RepID=A0A066WRT8_TILAU|nr:uncharacterized protein K437DRAFT_241928 [Tilletiaria anomala UBC 951]KDN53350.1 hypothetical protein K437DRAFT_241928 [Tilletiaria anomala UBC 951]